MMMMIYIYGLVQRQVSPFDPTIYDALLSALLCKCTTTQVQTDKIDRLAAARHLPWLLKATEMNV